MTRFEGSRRARSILLAEQWCFIANSATALSYVLPPARILLNSRRITIARMPTESTKAKVPFSAKRSRAVNRCEGSSARIHVHISYSFSGFRTSTPSGQA